MRIYSRFCTSQKLVASVVHIVVVECELMFGRLCVAMLAEICARENPSESRAQTLD